MRKYTVDLLCRRCKNKLGEVQSKFDKPRLQHKLCLRCKEKSLKHVKEMLTKRNRSQKQRKFSSKNMKDNNPMFDEKIAEKVGKKIAKIWNDGTGNFHRKQSKEHVRKRIENRIFSLEERHNMSKRMKNDNPMFQLDIRQKVAKTFRAKIKSSEITYKHGKDHHLWKGGSRNFNNACRSQLYNKWTIKIFERDNYTCTICDQRPTNRFFNAHHIKPLRAFVKEIKLKYDIHSFVDMDKEKWQPYIDEIIDAHKLEHGITVCKKCHGIIDKYYRDIKDKTFRRKVKK